MKRDMDLCRAILFEIEEKYKSEAIHNLRIANHEMIEVAYHCKLLYEAGLISEYNPMEADNGLLGFWVGPLTWDGHDYLDDIRDDNLWKKVKGKAKDLAIPLTLTVIKELAAAFIKKSIEGGF